MSLRPSPRTQAVLLIAALAAPAAPAATTGSAPAYPVKPIRLIVPFAPGGGADIVARSLGQKLTDVYKQPVVIDNRGGGTTVPPTEAVARAAADGYTLLMPTSAHVITPSFFSKLPYDTIRDFAPVT